MLRLPFWLLLASALTIQALPTLRPRDADFESVRTRLTKDHSGKHGDPKEKYFHESTFHPHYDGRFASKTLEYNERRKALTALMQTYLSTMASIGAETWIMHGSLLGWWWNRRIMPWDSDVDVMMSERSMRYLGGYWNMSVWHFSVPEYGGGEEVRGERGEGEGRRRNYMIEVNPHYLNGSTADKLNVIDARWIDTETGLFIDITTLRRDREADAKGQRGHMMCKDKHRFREEEIFPLRESTFENMPVKIPFAYVELLEEEYGKKALTRVDVENHHFDQGKMEWVRIDEPAPKIGKQKIKPEGRHRSHP